jgi:predicted nucleic acid-binding protein
MSEQEKRTKYFVIDTNVFVAAIKPFCKSSSSRTDPKTLELIVKLVTSDELELIGNQILTDEYANLAKDFQSDTSKLILSQLLEKMILFEINNESLNICKTFLPESASADVVIAATCLQLDAILITNDKDFAKIKQSGTIKVWSITEAIQRLL